MLYVQCQINTNTWYGRITASRVQRRTGLNLLLLLLLCRRSASLAADDAEDDGDDDDEYEQRQRDDEHELHLTTSLQKTRDGK
jgi:hypothetical protein